MALMPATPPISRNALMMEMKPKMRMMGTAMLARVFIHLVPLEAVIVMPMPARMQTTIVGIQENRRCAESPMR